MTITTSKNLTERSPIDLALGIALTLACILFVMVPVLVGLSVFTILLAVVACVEARASGRGAVCGHGVSGAGCGAMAWTSL